MMPKKGNPKDVAHGAKEAIVPTKKNASRNKQPLKISSTAQTDKPRITALATAGKKKKPK